MRVGIIVLGLAGCIEGAQGDTVHNITPRACETGIATDQTFVIDGDYELARQDRLRDAPPRFVLDGPELVELETTVGDYGQLTLRPLAPLAAEADFTLRLVEPGALAGVLLPPLFPASYSTRDTTELRSYRAIDNNIFMSFSRAIAPAAAAAITVPGTTITTPPTYLDAPGHVVHLRVAASGPVDVEIGAPALAVQQSVRLDPAYTVPATNGCERFD